MKNKKRIIISSIVILLALLIGLFLSTGSARTDVYLKEFSVDEKCNQMSIKVGVSSSAGYVRKMKRTSGSMNYYYTFYSTFGINSKLGAKDTFEITTFKTYIEKNGTESSIDSISQELGIQVKNLNRFLGYKEFEEYASDFKITQNQKKK